jgi:peptide chain release factor 2
MVIEMEKLTELEQRLSTIGMCFDIPAKEKEIKQLEKATAETSLWQDAQEASRLLQRLSQLRGTVNSWYQQKKRLSDLAELTQLVTEEADESLEKEIQAEVGKLSLEIAQLEFQQLLSGEYAPRNALIGIHAGAGGTESQDWAEMLMRMYLRWAERHNFQGELLDISPGGEVGIKSALIEVKGNYAYGYLKSEHGVHRLVRLSPFDADHARHTSFALVEVLPEVEGEVEVVIKPEDLKIETFRSSGPGGQHMQKTSTAVRLTHLPTGIVVSCQSQRSQHQNKENTFKILQARLLGLELEKKAEEKAKIKGEHLQAAWGNQIRSYILHPYKMVKDHRTGYESGNPNAVLDGDLDGLVQAYLELKAKE